VDFYAVIVKELRRAVVGTGIHFHVEGGRRGVWSFKSGLGCAVPGFPLAQFLVFCREGVVEVKDGDLKTCYLFFENRHLHFELIRGLVADLGVRLGELPVPVGDCDVIIGEVAGLVRCAVIDSPYMLHVSKPSDKSFTWTFKKIGSRLLAYSVYIDDDGCFCLIRFGKVFLLSWLILLFLIMLWVWRGIWLWGLGESDG
jgi:hypothetical protein